MSKHDTFENDLLKLILQGTAIANIADNAASAPLTNLYLSLHTAAPAEAGDQTSNEAAFTSYLRQAVARSGAGWSISGSTANLASEKIFGPKTGGSDVTVTHGGCGVNSSGAGKMLYSGPLTPSVLVEDGVAVRLTTASTITED